MALESDTVVSVITWKTLGLYFNQSPAKVIAIMQQMGQRIEGESEDAQNARFRRYILEYQSYLRIMERRQSR